MREFTEDIPGSAKPTDFYSIPVPLESDTYSVTEAAVVIGVDQVTIYKLRIRGFLHALPGIRHLRFPKKEVHLYAAGKILNPTPSDLSSPISTSATFSGHASTQPGRKRRARRKPTTNHQS